jgi:hypothetical protein
LLTFITRNYLPSHPTPIHCKAVTGQIDAYKIGGGRRRKQEQALNVMVEWLTALLRIRQVPGSYLGLEIGYPD